MNSTFFAIWIAILAFDGVLVAWLSWAVTSKKYGKYRIRPTQPNRIPIPRKHINVALNNLLALLIFIAYFMYLGEATLYAGWPGTTRFLGEVLGVLMLYDLTYYFYHRWMHYPKVMKAIHGVHHFVRQPSANESVYLNPLEQMGALAILIASIWLLGPISSTSFLVIFFIYSSVNIIVHSNLIFPHPAFRLFNFWVEKHDIHHGKIRYNYASIFPFWDQAFGTAK
ncbi:MAG: sterol desaturase family protein [Nevskiales bacterium]